MPAPYHGIGRPRPSERSRLVLMPDADQPPSARLLLAEIHGLGGGQAELATLLEELAVGSRQETGCEWFRVTRSVDPGEFVLRSLWKSQQALREHYQTAHYRRYRMRIGPMLARPSDVTLFTVTETVHAVDPNPPDPDLLG